MTSAERSKAYRKGIKAEALRRGISAKEVIHDHVASRGSRPRIKDPAERAERARQMASVTKARYRAKLKSEAERRQIALREVKRERSTGHHQPSFRTDDELDRESLRWIEQLEERQWQA